MKEEYAKQKDLCELKEKFNDFANEQDKRWIQLFTNHLVHIKSQVETLYRDRWITYGVYLAIITAIVIGILKWLGIC